MYMAEYTSSSLLMITFLLFRMTTMKICTAIRTVSTIYLVNEQDNHQLLPIVFYQFELGQSFPFPLGEKMPICCKLTTQNLGYTYFQFSINYPSVNIFSQALNAIYQKLVISYVLLQPGYTRSFLIRVKDQMSIF